MPGRTLSQRRRAALLDLGDQFNAAESIEAASQVASQFLGRALNVSRAGYAILDRTGGWYKVQRDWVRPDTLSIVGKHSLDDFAASFQRLKRREPVVVNDIARVKWLAPDRPGFQSLAVKAVIMIPLLAQGEPVGALFVHEPVPRNWTRGEVDLMRSVADRTYAAIAKIVAQEEQKILNEELVHRLKNTLAMVQSIASQTLQKATKAEAFDAFSNRLVALGRAHEALIEQRWTGADIRTVITNIMKLHCSDERCSIGGPDLVLGPRATLSLSMILNELATNAIKYGALSKDTGRLTISWHYEGEGDGANLVLTWKERGGPPVTEPAQRGFGSRLIKLGLTGTGQVEKHYLPAGFEAEFRAPITRLQMG